MALQITYKWDIPFVKTILKWHVEFGIGMAFTGFSISSGISPISAGSLKDSRSDNDYRRYSDISLHQKSAQPFIIGLVSSSVQLLLLREMMNISGGYELVTGIFLGSWLIGSCNWSSTGRKFNA